MPVEGEYEPSAWDWVASHVDRYESSGGTSSTTMQGKPTVVVTMRGRRSGKVRKAALMRVEHEGRYAIVASKGGDARHPEWYHNITADPAVTLRDGPIVRDMRARELEGDERDEWWARAVAAWPDYANYQRKTERTIPVLVLEPAG
ncbi:MAG TPA: nitroreductase family deazaflavin-dependent oxidoreductase [Acidimicrobiales bacterium]|nr:nitroreductase family deazaflavin-dependent oxidoreductase [Acidimicrobiales bacterium]